MNWSSRKNTTLRLVATGWLICCCLPQSLATSQDESLTLSERIAPVFDETTIAIAHLDLKMLDSKTLQKKLSEWSLDTLLPKEAIPQVMVQFKSIKKAVLNSGGRQVVLTLPLVDSIPTPIISFPLQQSNDYSKIEQKLIALKSFGYQSTYLAEFNLLVFGNSAALRRIETRAFPLRKDVGKVTAMMKNEIASINIVPSNDHLKVIREFVPQFPKPFDNVDGELLANGVRSVTLGLGNLEPLQLNLKIRSIDRGTAEKVMAALGELRKGIPVNGPELIFIKKLLADIELSKQETGLELSLGEDDERYWLALKPLFAKAQKQVSMQKQSNRLKQILLGLHNFHDAFRTFPDLGRPQDQGKSGLSWRVHILPFMGETTLYNQFKLNEPWDSEHNLKLVKQMPEFYRGADLKLEAGKTVIVMPRGEGFFARANDGENGKKGRSFRDILDGTSNTIAVLSVDSAQAVTWTQPIDWTPNQKSISALIANASGKHLAFATADGAVHQVPFKEITPERLKAWMTISGGELVPFER